MTAFVVEFISGLVCFVAIIALFGYIFKSIDLRIRIDIRSNQTLTIESQNKKMEKI